MEDNPTQNPAQNLAQKIEDFAGRAKKIAVTDADAAEDERQRTSLLCGIRDQISVLIGDLIDFEREHPDFRESLEFADFENSEACTVFLNLMEVLAFVRKELLRVIDLNKRAFDRKKREYLQTMFDNFADYKDVWEWRGITGLELPSDSLRFFEHLSDKLQNSTDVLTIGLRGDKWSWDKPGMSVRVSFFDKFKESLALKDEAEEQNPSFMERVRAHGDIFDNELLFDIADVLAEEADTEKNKLTSAEIADLLEVDKQEIGEVEMTYLKSILQGIGIELKIYAPLEGPGPVYEIVSSG